MNYMKIFMKALKRLMINGGENDYDKNTIFVFNLIFVTEIAICSNKPQ